MENEGCVVCHAPITKDSSETDCCNEAICTPCLKSLQGRNCPNCTKVEKKKTIVRNKTSAVPSATSAVSVGDEAVSAPSTSTIVQQDVPSNSENNSTNEKRDSGIQELDELLNDDENEGSMQEYPCPAPNCSFKGTRNKFAHHLMTVHDEFITENSRYCFIKESDSISRENGDIVAVRVNSEGKESHLGGSGKFYCGGQLNGPICSCRDQVCGPVYGCNCKSCQQLDIESRQLPPNWYVNKQGAPCRKDIVTGLFYCGRKIHLARSMDICGPNGGPSCDNCEEMNLQYNTRYQGIW